MPSAIIIGAANYGVVYLGALIFIKLLTFVTKEKKDFSTSSHDDIMNWTKDITNSIDKKSILKEAKESYKEERAKENNDKSASDQSENKDDEKQG